MPGMKVSGKFKVGQRRLITYFIYPLIRTLGTALRSHQMKIKLSFRLIVTALILILSAIFLGAVRISDPQFVEVMRLKYFDQLQKKYPRSTEGQTYSVIVDIDEKSLRNWSVAMAKNSLATLNNQKKLEC